MVGRLLSAAAVLLLVGAVVSGPARAQNLEAGKSPAQIFSSTCAVCHKSPRGLVRTVPPGSLASFLRQHYTTSSDMAAMLSSYLMSNGAVDPRARQNDAKPEPTSRRHHRSGEEAAKPEEAAPQAEETGRRGRHRKRHTQPAVEKPAEAAPAAEAEPAAASEPRPTNRSKHGRKSRHGHDKPADAEPAKDAAKSEAVKPEAVKPESKSETKPAAPAAEAPSRADPVPAVSPAPKPADTATPKPAPSPAGPPAEKRASPAPSQPSSEVVPPPPAPPSGSPDVPVSK
jgi:hypothetical protein